MNTLLALPAVGIIYLQALGRNVALAHAVSMGAVQALLAAPFAIPYPRSYLARAFELTRQFFYKWTVNWRFVSEDMFLSKEFAIGLLVIHAISLVVFAVAFWIRYGAHHYSHLLINLLKKDIGLVDNLFPDLLRF